MTDRMTLDTDEALETALIVAFRWATPRDRNEAARTAQPQHFHHGRNRTLWEHITRLHHHNQPVEIVAILDSLDAAGHLDHVGGIHHVTGIFTDGPDGSDVSHYAQRVAARARRRHAALAARDLANALDGDAIPVDTAIHGGVADILNAGRNPNSATVHPDAITAAVNQLRADGPDTGWRSGWDNIDGLYRPAAGQLSVVTGIPAAGKTTWLNAYLARLAHRYGHRYLLFSPEQSSAAKHAARIAAVHAGPRLSDESHATALRWVLDHFAWVDHRAAATLDDVVATARLECDRDGLDGLVVDPWNWLETGRPEWMTETDHINRSLNDLIRVAQDLRVHVWVVAHPRKVRQHESGVREGQYLVVRPYDIASSAAWFNKPWFVVSLWRDHLAPTVAHGSSFDPDRDPELLHVHVQKVRDDDQGAIGSALLRMQSLTKRYAEPTRRSL